MTERLYLVGYDIGEPKRQALIRYHIKNYSASGQQSAYECLLSSDDKRTLTELAHSKIECNDRFFMIKTMSTYFSQVAKDNPANPQGTDKTHFYIG